MYSLGRQTVQDVLTQDSGSTLAALNKTCSIQKAQSVVLFWSLTKVVSEYDLNRESHRGSDMYWEHVYVFRMQMIFLQQYLHH